MKKIFIRLRLDLFLGVILGVSFLITRLVNLTIIPIFTDEAIYLRWSQKKANDASLRYLPLVDGKPPLFMWLTSIFIKLFPRIDILMDGRFVAVGAGIFCLAGVFFTSYRLFKNRGVSWLASFLYVFVPFTLFYDRIGLADSLLAAFAVWALGLTVWLVESLRLDVAFLLGMAIGFGLLTKSPALFLLVYLPLSLVVFNFSRNGLVKRLLKLFVLFSIVLVISQGVYSVLRLFPLFNMISQKNFEFSLTLKQFLANPLLLVPANLTTLIRWEIEYITVPVTFTIFIAVFSQWQQQWKQKILIVSYFLIHFVYLTLFNKIIYPRFLLTFTPILLILSAYGINSLTTRFKLRLGLIALLAVIFGSLLVVDFRLLTSPTTAPIPQADTNQYLNSWSAGFGVSEIRQYLTRKSAESSKITVGVEGTFGLMPYSLDIYQSEYPNVIIKSYWPLPDKTPAEIVSAAKDHPTYFIIYQRQTEPKDWHLSLIASYKQGIGLDRLRFYQVNPN